MANANPEPKPTEPKVANQSKRTNPAKDPKGTDTIGGIKRFTR